MDGELERRFRAGAEWVWVDTQGDDRLATVEVLVWGGYVHGVVEVFRADEATYYGAWPTGRTGAMLTRAGAREGVARGVLARVGSPALCPVEGTA